MFKSTPIVCSWSRIVNPRCAITEILDFPMIFSTNPETVVSLTSEMDPTYRSDTKLTAPLGVHPTKMYCGACSWTALKIV